MSHQNIIIRNNVQNGKREIEVFYEPEEAVSGDDARAEATKWVEWVKEQNVGPD